MIVRPVNRPARKGKFMNDAETLNTRIEQLETRIAHQDLTIEDLNKSVTGQWRQIDDLTKQVERMAARLQHVEANASPGAAEPPPPHY
jgi:SlyX protein